MPPDSLSITNGRVLVAGSIVECDLVVAGGTIAATASPAGAAARLDVAGAYVLPGLIDLHTHGIGMASAYDESLAEFARLEASRGATTFFPTLFGPPPRTVEALERHRRSTSELKDLPQIGGFRLESPYLGFTGGGNSGDLAPITETTTSALLEAGGGHIAVWDISPELSGAVEAIAQLTQAGVVCSIAHTRATIDQAKAAVDAGASLVTHLFDTFAAPPMDEPGVFPVSLIDYLLVEDRLTCEIIGDGLHVHPLQVEIALRCCRPDRVAFVTDSNLGAGLPPGEFLLPNDWGWGVVSGPNSGVRLRDRNGELAGSALTPIDAFRNAIRLFGRDLATASRLCSATPARLLRLNKGEIASGREADLIVLNDDLELLYTMVGGQVVYRREG